MGTKFVEEFPINAIAMKFKSIFYDIRHAEVTAYDIVDDFSVSCVIEVVTAKGSSKIKTIVKVDNSTTEIFRFNMKDIIEQLESAYNYELTRGIDAGFL